MKKRDVTAMRISAPTLAAAVCLLSMPVAASYEWRGSTGEWSGSAANWWNGAELVPWADGSDASLPAAGDGAQASLAVAPAGVSAGTLEQSAGSSYTLSGGPLTAAVLLLNGGEGSAPASLTVNNQVCAGDFRFGGRLTVASGGTLTAGSYTSTAETADGLDAAVVTVLAGGALEVTNFNTSAGGYSTLYVDGGTVKNALTRYQDHGPFSNSRIKVGPNGMRVAEAEPGQQSYLPYPVESSGDTDGGLWVDRHTGYYILYGDNTYRGGLHLMPSGGQLGIQSDGNLGAAPDKPEFGIVIEADAGGNYAKGPVIVSHSTDAVVIGENRDIFIGDRMMARFSAYSATSKLVIRGAVDCADRENGVMFIGDYRKGTVALETAGSRTNNLGRLIVTEKMVVGGGTTLLNNSTKLSHASSGETSGVKDGAALNIRDNGHLAVTGGVLKVSRSRHLCNSARLTVSDGGLADLTTKGSYEFLHGYDGPAVTTVRDGGRLVVSTIRMAGDNAAYYGDGANSVMNVDTGGVLRVTGKIYITDAAKRGILNFNGGTLEWAGSSNISGWDQYLAASRVGLAVCVKEGGMVVSNDTTFYIEQPVASGANEDGGIVKWGAGTFALVSPNNTFNGPVRVMQGDFTTYSDMINPINTNCEVIVNADCRFRANASKHKFARIGGSGWFIENTDRNLTVWKAIAPGMGADSPGTLGISGGPINIEDGVSLEIDLDENGRSDCLDYYEELDLSKLSLKVNDVAKLDAKHRYLIAKNVTAVSGGFKTTNLPDGWKVRYSADSRELKIVPLKGMVLIVK